MGVQTSSVLLVVTADSRRFCIASNQCRVADFDADLPGIFVWTLCPIVVLSIAVWNYAATGAIVINSLQCTVQMSFELRATFHLVRYEWCFCSNPLTNCHQCHVDSTVTRNESSVSHMSCRNSPIVNAWDAFQHHCTNADRIVIKRQLGHNLGPRLRV